MDFEFSVCIVMRGAAGARVSSCCILHDLQFVNTGRGCNRRPYRRGILQSRSHNYFIGSHACLRFTLSCCSECFMICRGLYVCTEMLWMCVLYVSFESKVRPRTFWCVAMGSILLCIFRSRLLVYSAGSGVNRVQVVLFSPVSLQLLRGGCGLYEVPMFLSLLGFGIGTMLANFHV